MFKIRKEQKEALAGEFGTVGMLAPCAMCINLVVVEIKGLFEPQQDAQADGTIREAHYWKGYKSEDDLGRIYINHETNGTGKPGTGRWKARTQGIEITVKVEPEGVPIPPGTMVTWSFEDPDDPSNQDPKMRKSAGMILDPNDYQDPTKPIATGGDNAKIPPARSKPGFEQIEPRYPLNGHQTPVDPVTRLAKVRFNTSDVAGDNYLVRATVNALPPVIDARGVGTGVMTLWNRVDVEYVKMKSARDLPVDQLANCFRHAFMEVNISKTRVVTGNADKPIMGTTENAASDEVEAYAGREFSMKWKAGWILLIAARRFKPHVPAAMLYAGEAIVHPGVFNTAEADGVSVPLARITHPDRAAAIKIYDPSQTAGAMPSDPADIRLFTVFYVKFRYESRDQFILQTVPKLYFKPDNFDGAKPDWEANLTEYGLEVGQRIKVRVYSEGDEFNGMMGLSVNTTLQGKHQSKGITYIFTDTCPPALYLHSMVHELTHAFENQHMCGNWDWTTRTALNTCAMNYHGHFMLTNENSKKRNPILWTQGKVSAELCASHLKRLREYHTDENAALDWAGRTP